MSILLFSNNAGSTLQNAISAGATSITLAAGTGVKFPSPGAGQYFVGTLVDAATGLVDEIVWVTAVSGDTLTVVRAQEGTTAKAWNAGDFFNNFWTGGSASQMLQQGQYQQQSANYATDSGVADADGRDVEPRADVGMTQLIGAPVRVNVAHTNTSTTVTLNPNGLGNQPVKVWGSGGATNPTVGSIVAAGIYTFIWDGTEFQEAGAAAASSAVSGNYYGTDTGAANAYVVTLSPVPASLAALDGQIVSVLIANSNTSATPTININSLGATLVAGTGGDTLLLGAIPSGVVCQFVYNSSGNYFQCLGEITPSSNSGTGTSAKGYIRFPGGTILQWGAFGTATGNADVVNLPVAFPTAYAIASNPGVNANPVVININGGYSLSAFQVTSYVWNGSGFTKTSGVGVDYVAVGY